MREYHVRLTVRTNNRPDEAGRGEPYYDDQEMAGQIRTWFDDALFDRDDAPQIIWSETVLRGTTDNHNHQFTLPARDEDTCIAFPGCTVTWGQAWAARP